MESCKKGSNEVSYVHARYYMQLDCWAQGARVVLERPVKRLKL